MIKKRKLWKAFAGTLAAMVSFVAVAQPISYLPNLENALVAEAYDVGYYVTNRSTGARVYAEPNGSVRGAAQMNRVFLCRRSQRKLGTNQQHLCVEK